jgi:hypothetical protein
MSPTTTFSASLVLSLALWFPTMRAYLAGDLDVTGAGIRLLVAFVAARIAMAGLAYLISAYQRAAAAAEHEAEANEDARTDAMAEAA